jgi:putative thioredoxin
MATDATEVDFQQTVIDRSREVPVVVDFWAEWCGPCRQLTPALERAAAERAGKVELVKVDVDGNPALAREYGVQAIPAVKAFRDGMVVDEFVGAQPAPMVERFMDRLVPSEADALVAEGDEQSLRRALALEPGRPDAADELLPAYTEKGLEAMIGVLERTEDEDTKDRIRKAMVGVFTDLGPDHPLTREYRRKLAAALY